MRKESVLLLVGILVFVAPLLGVPEVWRAGLLFCLGGIIILVAILFRSESRRRVRDESEILHREHDPHQEPLVTRQ